jgi:hypothetical protein
MKKYIDLIESAPIIDHVDTVVTTGDPEYPGTALEVWERNGRELFHVVVDSFGEKQILFLAGNYRLPLARLEEIIAKAKEEVRFVDET